MLHRTFLPRCASDVKVANTGSVCRDHLANERTFLAFARTSFSFLGGAIAIFTSYSFNFDESVQSSVHPSEIMPSVAGFMFNSVVLLGYSMKRFLHVQDALATGHFVIAKRRLCAVVALTVLVTGASLANLYAVEMARKPLPTRNS